MGAQSEPARAVAPPSDPAPVNPQKADVVRQMVGFWAGKEEIHRITNAKMPEVRKMLLQDLGMPPALADEVIKRYSQRLQDLDWAQFYIPVYAKNFTLEELRQIAAFYRSPPDQRSTFERSPLGQKLKRLQPTIHAEARAAGKAKDEQIGKETIAEVAVEHPDYLYQLQESVRKKQTQK